MTLFAGPRRAESFRPTPTEHHTPSSSCAGAPRRDDLGADLQKKMLEGRSQGPKTSRWTKRSRTNFEAFFARRSEPLQEAATEELHVDATLDFKWIFRGLGGQESQQVSASVDGAIVSTVLDVMARSSRSALASLPALELLSDFGSSISARCPRARRPTSVPTD